MILLDKIFRYFDWRASMATPLIVDQTMLHGAATSKRLASQSMKTLDF